MKVYTVGGYVRDKLMGQDPKDCDYVVVGSTITEMESLGYEQVGKDFPVFLHPKTGDEYALARTERKIGAGYGGFSVETQNVTLEEDLFRRDLTINAMALDENNNLIDPYNGQEDLKNKVLRHVSVHFKEDPVRILRIARFSARYNFSIAPETLTLMKEMVEEGEFDALTSERVWKEFEKVLTEPYVENFFSNLEKIGALERLPGFSNIQEKDFFKFVSENHNDKLFSLNLAHTFSQMDNKTLKTWKIPTDLMVKITQFKFWKEKEGFYNQLSTEDKLTFIQQNKGVHNIENVSSLLSNTLIYRSWKEQVTPELESNLDSLNQDINKLKDINYENIVKEALAHKEKPNEKVKEAQLKVLNKKVGMRP